MNVVEELPLYYHSLQFCIREKCRVVEFLELHVRDRTENKVRSAKRWPGSLTSSLTDACFPFLLCCEGSEQDRENAAKGLSTYVYSSQQQSLSRKSLAVIAASRKWFERVISELHRAQSHIQDWIKKPFDERNEAWLRARRWLGPLTSCRREVSAFDSSLVC